MGFKGAFSPNGRTCCGSAIENCGSLFVTAEQCKSDRTLKERRKRTGETGAPFSFRETGFFAKTYPLRVIMVLLEISQRRVGVSCSRP